VAGAEIVIVNDGGVLRVADCPSADAEARAAIVDAIAAAEDDGEPYGRGSRSARPVSTIRVHDPLGGGTLPPEDVLRIVDDLIAEGVVRVCRGHSRNFLSVSEAES